MGVKTKTVTNHSHTRTKSQKVKDSGGSVVSSTRSKMDTAFVNREKPLPSVPKVPEPVIPAVLLPDYIHTSVFRYGFFLSTLCSHGCELYELIHYHFHQNGRAVSDSRKPICSTISVATSRCSESNTSV